MGRTATPIWLWIRSNRGLLIVVLLVLIAYFAFRTTPSEVNDLDSLVTGGRPTVINFYSNF